MFSCSNEQELKPDVKILREDWHRLANINYVAQNEPVHTIVEKFFSKNNLGNGYSVSFSKETIHFLSGDFSQVFASKKNPENYLIVNVSSSEDLRYFFIEQSNQVFTFTNNADGLFKFDAVERRLISAKTNAYPGNCNALGGARPGEDFGDCFIRNWENFCCSWDGCGMQYVFPQSVVIAIGIECSPALAN